MSENGATKEKTIELLEELVKWTKVTSIPKVKEVLNELVKSPEEKIAYNSSDGERTTREVAEIAKTNKDTVSRFWRKWIRAGIAEPFSTKGGNRAKSLFSLEDFGIDVPELSKASNENSTIDHKTEADNSSQVKNNE